MQGIVTLNEGIYVSVSDTGTYCYTTSSDGNLYYRKVTTTDDMDLISCLVKDDKVYTAYVFTWVGFIYQESTVRPFFF